MKAAHSRPTKSNRVHKKISIGQHDFLCQGTAGNLTPNDDDQRGRQPPPFPSTDTVKPLRLVFMGTPDFAVPSLRTLVEGPDTLVGVVTQPDQPAGRGMALRPSAVKACALEHDIPVFQPAKLRPPEVMARLRDWQPDLLVIAAYGKLLPTSLLDLPPHGCINVHASLLPKYRGAAPIQWAIAHGERQTGVTIMQVNEYMDAGDILLQKACSITETETGGSLHDTLSVLGAETLDRALGLLKHGRLVARPQDESQVTYAPAIKKEDGRIDWTQDALSIERRIRAFHPWPSAYTSLRGRLLKISAVRVMQSALSDVAPGTVLPSTPGQLLVATGRGALALEEVQLAGKKRLAITAFLRGQPQTPGTLLGT